MTATSKALPGAGDIYLQIGASTVALRFHTHPDYQDSCAVDANGNVPAAWVITALIGHLSEHPAEELADPPTEPPTTVGPDLDPFAREVAAGCRWAMDANEGDTDDTWPIPVQLAVALVLGNHEYLSATGPGPGYTPQRAVVLLLMEAVISPPADLDAWINIIRAEIRRSTSDDRSGLLSPSTFRQAGGGRPPAGRQP